MSRPTFLHGVMAAFALAIAASVTIAALLPFVGFYAVIRLVIPLLALAYLLYLLRHSRERVGRVTTLVSWSVLAAVSWWLTMPLPLYLLVHVTAVWLVRTLYFQSGFSGALLDLGLGAAGIAAAAWSLGESGSIFLATWCFFLVQALFVAIPASADSRQDASCPTAGEERFARARRQADRALNQLFTQ